VQAAEEKALAEKVEATRQQRLKEGAGSWNLGEKLSSHKSQMYAASAASDVPGAAISKVGLGSP
jgi:hypothetical protein